VITNAPRRLLVEVFRKSERRQI